MALIFFPLAATEPMNKPSERTEMDPGSQTECQASVSRHRGAMSR